MIFSRKLLLYCLPPHFFLSPQYLYPYGRTLRIKFFLKLKKFFLSEILFFNISKILFFTYRYVLQIKKHNSIVLESIIFDKNRMWHPLLSILLIIRIKNLGTVQETFRDHYSLLFMLYKGQETLGCQLNDSLCN